ncbi:hypothetical protein SDC9_71455 [bioreactor metagenome]|uniref:Gram-positive cocci surface proteins LPxTG domain-containing protein n=1 Tax=bioreactor metagenome TaxID=1076179 RepID=A0A644Y8R9_9ZZZZ
MTPPTKETEIPEEKPPLSELPAEAEIPEETVPLAPAPESAELEIVEDEVPLGNLPQTGTMAEPVRPMWTLGMLALSFSMAAVGLTVTFGRKRDEEEK